MSFRQKIFISYLAIFLIVATLLYPIVAFVIGEIQENNLSLRTQELIEGIETSPNFRTLIERLKQKEKYLFFRVTLLDAMGTLQYDSHRTITGFNPEEKSRPEIDQAQQKKTGYDVRYSRLFGQEMAYVARPFEFEGQSYILRTASPYGEIKSLTRDLSITFLILAIALLLLFSFFAWFILHYLTRPVQQIIQAIKPYQLGKSDHIPEIKLTHEADPNDDFGRLAETLNSLSKRIEQQIATLRQEKNEKSAILESLVEGVIAVDQELNIIYMNKMAETFLGIPQAEMKGRNVSTTKHPKLEELVRQAQLLNQPVADVLQPDRKQKRYLDVVAVPRGQNKGAILVLQDKTGLHKVVEMGRDFIANASHELKTPITIIRGFAETLHDHPELSREISQEITEKIVSNCQRMDTLVRNLLTLAALDEGLPRSRLQEGDLVDLAQEAKHTILAIHPEANIQIETVGKEPFYLMIDGDLFLQAIINLLDNGVKYSKVPAQVRVQIIKKENSFEFKVSDKGIGIPQEDLDRIFERFYAVDKSHSRSLGGSGLGLSIVERIVEKHQGKIEVESQVGEGTMFTITLPIQDENNY